MEFGVMAIRFLIITEKTLTILKIFLKYQEPTTGADSATQKRAKQVDRAVRDYVAWYDKWKDRRNSNGRLLVDRLPLQYEIYAGFLAKRAAGERLRKIDHEIDVARHQVWNADDARRFISRDIEKMKKLRDNVASGVFPGRYR